MEYRREAGERGMSNEPELVTAASLQHSMRGVDYPTGNQKILPMAAKNKAPESISEIIRRMPDKDYQDPGEVSEGAGEMK